MILVKRFFAYNELRNYSYLIQDDQTGDCWVIDPFEANPIKDFIKKNDLVLCGILNTHQHFDHIRGNSPLVDYFKTSVRKLKNTEKIQINSDYFIESLDTPGHTLDHQAFIWKEKDRPLALFSGDTLFNAGVGNCKNGGDVNDLYETSLKLINNLPKSTLLYPGHDYRRRNLEFSLMVEPHNSSVKEQLRVLEDENPECSLPTTLKDELEWNPFFRLNSDEIRQNVFVGAKSKKEIFIKLRQLRDKW